MVALDFPSSPSNGQVFGQYVYDGTKEVWRLNPEAPNANLDNLNDVTITTPTDGQALVFDSASGDWINETPASTVDSLTDTTITTPANDESLVYDTATSKWINNKRVINTDGDPGTKIYVGTTDPDGTYTLQAGDIWIEAP
jgi:hypothetical protein